MTRREKIGAGILVCLMSFFALLLVFTIKRPTGPTRGFSDNVLIQQRIKNLQNQR